MKIIEGFDKAKALFSRQDAEASRTDDEREKTVNQIVKDVRESGDAALFDYTEKFDGVKLTSLEVDKKSIERAYQETDKELLDALKLAAERITAYHLEQKKKLVQDNKTSKLGWLMRPLRSVGVHVPGFSAPLPSSLLMTAIPARTAGVKEIILVTPPQSNGKVSPITLAAAKIAGVDRVFSVGGAQAIAALAFGTESIPRVDKVCGPGNIYVTLAKKALYGTVGIDGLYGPSEVVIIADKTANVAYVAADLLAQAEHGSLASAIMITTSKKIADDVNDEIEKQLQVLQRQDITAESLEKRGLIALVDNVDEAIELANIYAPEHLCLIVKDAASYIEKVDSAGCLFVGEDSIEALVDYVAGPSHVLPTEGTARFGSGLNILDFMKLISLVKTGKADIKQLGRAATVIARAEGLDAHARAVEKRLEDAGQGGS
ncbi:MAG: histidinol dehydrogenase [Chloroflexi bacterium RBG_13_52_12]|nr:MAG: histidinol dehydrogenase [Chloroflexi bacterium RBG_13_52_12]